jgi:predicted ribosomally synthesized peptide with SipW-like signal peptide
MKKILISLLTIVAVSGLVFGATRAFFTDTETSTGNVLGTGTFNVSLGGTNNSNGSSEHMENYQFFNVDGMMPGGDPEVAYVEVRNDSSAPMLFRLYADNLSGTKSLRNHLNVKVTMLGSNSGYDSVLDGKLYEPGDGSEIYNGPLSGIEGVNDILNNVRAGCNKDQPLGYIGGEGDGLYDNNVAAYKVEVWLDWDTPNNYQGKSLTADLHLDATQFNKDVCDWSDGLSYTAW